MHHRLLILCPDKWHVVADFFQRLTEPGDIAMPKDAKDAGDQTLANAIALAVLGGEEADGCLGNGESTGVAHGIGVSCERLNQF
jgi:hypothetical protein